MRSFMRSFSRSPKSEVALALRTSCAGARPRDSALAAALRRRPPLLCGALNRPDAAAGRWWSRCAGGRRCSAAPSALTLLLLLHRKSIGSPLFLDVKYAEDADFHAKIRYTIPLSWCHSFDPDKPVGENEGDDNLPVVQGGLIGSWQAHKKPSSQLDLQGRLSNDRFCLQPGQRHDERLPRGFRRPFSDHALDDRGILARHAARAHLRCDACHNDRWDSRFCCKSPSFEIPALVLVRDASELRDCLGLQEVTMYRDEECTYSVARASSTSKLRKPSPKL